MVHRTMAKAFDRYCIGFMLLCFFPVSVSSKSHGDAVTRFTVRNPHDIFFGTYHNARNLAKVDDMECKVVEECSLCDAVSRADTPECSKTGRIERLSCAPIKDEGRY